MHAEHAKRYDVQPHGVNSADEDLNGISPNAAGELSYDPALQSPSQPIAVPRPPVAAPRPPAVRQSPVRAERSLLFRRTACSSLCLRRSADFENVITELQ